MKKFLTVLLVIAVMFTFSFGSAFAASWGEDNYSASIGDPSFETMWADAVKVTTGTNGDKLAVFATVNSYWIDKAVIAGFKAEAKALYDYYMMYEATGYINSSATLLDEVFNFNRTIENAQNDATTLKQEAFKLELVKAQFAVAKEKALAVVNSVPTYSYSTEVMSYDDAYYAQNTLTGGDVKFVDKDYTYAEAAEKLVKYFVDEIEDSADIFDADSTFSDYANALDNAFTNELAYFYPMAYATYDASTPVAKVTALALTGAYDFGALYNGVTTTAKTYDNVLLTEWPTGANNGYFISVGKDVNKWSADAIATAGKLDAATVAAVKAQNAANYASYIVGKDAATVKKADKWLKVADALAEAGYTYSTAKPIVAPGTGTTLADYAAAADEMADLEYWAARYAAEKNADGELIRDAAVVEKLLAKGLKAVASIRIDANKAITVGGVNINTPALFSDYYIGLIYDAVSATTANKLAFEKDAVKKAVELLLADYVEDEVFFAAEYADVKEAADECLAAVEVATEADDVEKAYGDFLDEIDGIYTADELVQKYITDMATDNTAADILEDAAVAYATYHDNYNDPLDLTADYNTTTLQTRIAKMMGESGLRTEKELKKLTNEAVAIAQGLPTKAEVAAAKKTVEAAIKALPVKYTVADLALVQAASDAIDAYQKLDTTDVTAGYDATKLIPAYNTQFAQAYAKLAKTDEAGLKALYAEIDAVVETLLDLDGVIATDVVYLKGLQTQITDTHLAAIKAKEYEAVVKAIKAIPINVTEADKATVEAARALYDAYVAKYTDVEEVYNDTTVNFTGAGSNIKPADYLDGYAAFAVGELTAAETVLGLNDNSEEIAKLEAIASVEGLKITAKSSAKKGSITVKWTVEGDDANVKYYEIRKSTKKNSGFGTKPYFTTTKMTYKNTKGLEAGTRYYFKVRAVAEIDGETYVSDWSNKAYRVAK